MSDITINQSKDNTTMFEIIYLQRKNLGNYNHEEYSFKITGTEVEVKKQIENKENMKNMMRGLKLVVQEVGKEVNKEISENKVNKEISEHKEIKKEV